MSCIDCPTEVHVGDVGTRFILHITECEDGVEQDVSLETATELKVWFLLPDDSVIDEDGTVLTPPGTDGRYYYDAQDGDLSIDGCWEIQGRVTFPGGKWHSCRASFDVFPNIK